MRGVRKLQPEVNPDVALNASRDTVLSLEAGLVLSTVLGDEGVDFSQAGGLVSVLGGPCPPFGRLAVQAAASLCDEFEDAFCSGFNSCGPVASLLGLLEVPPARQAPVTA